MKFKFTFKVTDTPTYFWYHEWDDRVFVYKRKLGGCLTLNTPYQGYLTREEVNGLLSRSQILFGGSEQGGEEEIHHMLTDIAEGRL